MSQEVSRGDEAFALASLVTQQQDRLLSGVLSSIRDFAYALDRDGRFLFVNQPLLDL